MTLRNVLYTKSFYTEINFHWTILKRHIITLDKLIEISRPTKFVNQIVTLMYLYLCT